MAAHLLLTEVQRLCVSLRFSHERLSKEDKSLRHTVTSLTTQLASVTKENKDFNEIVLPDFWFHTTIHLVLLPCGYGCFSAVDGPEAEALTILMSVRSFICLIDDSIVQDMSRIMCPMHHTTSVSASLSVKPPDNFNKTFSGPHHETENWTSNIATFRNVVSTCQGFAGTYKANMWSHCWFSHFYSPPCQRVPFLLCNAAL